MKDVRARAEERARRYMSAKNGQQSGPPGGGFESERTQAKEALRAEINTQNGQNVQKIAAEDEIAQKDRILRVAAYCRVSTDDIDQVISIELQKNNYRDMIKANPNWRYVGTYVDDGFSGTNTERRPAFRLMMRDAMAGKIDMIITKSVSRFARNLVDCMEWVGKLKEFDSPIAVFFEQENLNTLDKTSNIILFVLAMVAEEESHMKSEAMLFSLEWRFSRGRFLTPKLLGYDRIEIKDEYGNTKKVLVINEDQAQTVRLMYYMLLGGSSTAEIAETLTELKRETGHRLKDGTMNTHWTASGVTAVMRNERYCGDVLARKTWTPNFKDHKVRKNRGKKNRYYRPAHHKAIVTRAQWNAAQRILNSHRYSHSGGYMPMQVIDHGALCGYISVNRSWAGFDADDYCRVSSIAMGLEEGELDADLENEHLPDGGRRIPGLTDDGGVQRIARELSLMEQVVKAQMEGLAPETQEEEETPKVREGFQVVSADMFSHAFDPVVRIDRKSIAFNSTCIGKMNGATVEDGVIHLKRRRNVELLFNPVERMLAVRPCDENHPNALRWATEDGKSVTLGATAFCRILYSIMDWDADYSYRVPAIVRRKNGETVIFFDLDNYSGRELGVKNKKKDFSGAEKSAEGNETDGSEEQTQITVEEDTKGIFYAAEDDEPQEIEDVEAMEQRLKEIAEIEARTFGTAYFEYDGDARLPAIDEEGEWEVMAEARVLDEDHRVDEKEVENLQYKLMEDMYAAEGAADTLENAAVGDASADSDVPEDSDVATTNEVTESEGEHEHD